MFNAEIADPRAELKALLAGEPLAPRPALTQRVSGKQTLVLENLLTEGPWRLSNVGGVPSLERVREGFIQRGIPHHERIQAMQAAAAELAAGSAVDPEPPGLSEALKRELQERGYW